VRQSRREALRWDSGKRHPSDSDSDPRSGFRRSRSPDRPPRRTRRRRTESPPPEAGLRSFALKEPRRQLAPRRGLGCFRLRPGLCEADTTADKRDTPAPALSRHSPGGFAARDDGGLRDKLPPLPLHFIKTRTGPTAATTSPAPVAPPRGRGVTPAAMRSVPRWTTSTRLYTQRHPSSISPPCHRDASRANRRAHWCCHPAHPPPGEAARHRHPTPRSPVAPPRGRGVTPAVAPG